MAELAPWRVRCTVLSIGYNIAAALLGGSTPMVAEWLLARTHVVLAPGIYLALAAAVTCIAALRLPRAARHRLTTEFQAATARDAALAAPPIRSSPDDDRVLAPDRRGDPADVQRREP
jgi:MHS family proline/betaine transporter-like MFS transporter